MVHGITSSTVKHFVVDAGAVYLNYGEASERLLGATSGGNSFTVEQEVREPEIDGAKGPVKGARRITRRTAKITANLIEITTENILAAIPGSEAKDYPATEGKTHDSITCSKDITNANYFKNVALVGKVSGSDGNFIGIIENALSDGNFEMSLEDAGEAVIEVTFTAHYDPANLDKEPWEIRLPVVEVS